MQRTIAEHALVARGDRVLVGLSGGPDSIALLHALVTLAPRLGITVEAAVVDHGMRTASKREARVAAAQAAQLGVRCEIVKVDMERI